MPWLLAALAGTMPTILVWLSRLIFSRGGAWIVSAFVFLGVYLGTQTIVVEPMLDQITAIATGTPGGAVAQWVAFLNFDKALTMILSAYAASFSVSAAKVALYKR